jgi:hypothetical protein
MGTLETGSGDPRRRRNRNATGDDLLTVRGGRRLASIVAVVAVCAGGALAMTSANGLAARRVGVSAQADPSRGAAVAGTRSIAASKARLAGAYGHLPLAFEPNRGQTDARVDFLARGAGYTLFLTPRSALLALRRAAPPARGARVAKTTRAAVLRMALVGGNPHPGLVGRRELRGRVNYLLGNDPRRWQVGVPTFAQVLYRDVYPGVDLVYYGRQGRLEYDFRIRPGANPDAIAFRLQGAKALELDRNGDLVLSLPSGTLRMQRPHVYQLVDGVRRPVGGCYLLRAGGRVGFRVGAYDRRRPLVIDPNLLYSTYLGGTGEDRGQAIAVDNAGNAYVTGYTDSPNFPDTGMGPGGGYLDAFVTELNPNASGSASLVYSTYLGGSDVDAGQGIAVDAFGDAYVTGYTYSLNFPTTATAFHPKNGGTFFFQDAFVTELGPTGTLLHSTYLGGSGGDNGFGIAVDGTGAYITGGTSPYGFNPTQNDFPTTPGAYQTTPPDGPTQAFITKLDPTLSTLRYSTFLGGAVCGSFTQGRAIAVDALGNAWVTGQTNSGCFPTTSGAYQTINLGGYVAYVAELNSAGSNLLYSTYLSASGTGSGYGIATDGARNAYVVGFSGQLCPTCSGFPTTPGAFQPGFKGGNDAFVAKFTAGGMVVYSTLLGGGSDDVAYGVAADAAGDAYVTGSTLSSDFPTMPGAYQTTPGGQSDAFVTKLKPDGSGLLDSTYLGGSGSDTGFGIAIDAEANAYITGETSGNFPTTMGAYQTTYGGGNGDAFVTKIATSDTTPPVFSAVPPSLTAEATGPGGAAVGWSISVSDPDDAASFSCSPASGSTFALGTTTVNCTASDTHGNTATASFTVTVVDTTPPALSNVPASVTLEASGPGGAVAAYTAPSATDLVDGARPVGCSPASGSTFALGANTVTCTASDTRGNTATASFTVTVVDTTPPMFSNVPPSFTLDATGPSGAVATYTSPSATDLVDGARPVSCNPASGLTFPFGPTTVTCTASDTHGNTASASFTVTVRNVAPSVSLTAPVTSVNEGSSVTYSFAVSDPDGDVTPFTFEAGLPSCGSAGTLVSSSVGSASFVCSFPSGPASSTVSVAVVDSHGAASNVASAVVTVNDVAPMIALSSSNTTSIPEGTASSTQYSYSYQITEPDATDAVTVAVGCGTLGTLVSGSATNTRTSGSFKCTFNSVDGPASSTVSATATDSEGLKGPTATQTVTILTVPPTVKIVAPLSGSSYATYSTVAVSATFNDPTNDVDGPHTCSVTWTPGVSSTGTVSEKSGSGTCSASHLFTASGSYTIGVAITDKNGAVGSATPVTITVK